VVAERAGVRMLPDLILERAFAFANPRAPLPYLSFHLSDGQIAIAQLGRAPILFKW